MQARWLFGSVMLGVLAGSGGASMAAVAVTAEVTSHQVFLGDAVNVHVSVQGGDAAPEVVAPASDDIEFKLLTPQPQRSSFQQIINGRVSGYVRYTYIFSVRPKRTGSLVIPPFAVTVGGATYRTEQIALEVVSPEEQDLLIAQITAERESAYVEEPVRLELKIWVRKKMYRGEYLSARATFEWVSVPTGGDGLEEWGRFGYGDAKRAGLDGREYPYYLFSASREFHGESAGRASIEPKSLLLRWPAGLRADFFGDLRVESWQRVVARVEQPGLTIKPLPEQGRPESFTWAVGRYQIEASAKPTKVRVGDPITLAIRVSGTGRLETIGPPALTKQESLTAHFRVPDEKLVGVIENGAKVFTQSIRATGTSVKEIPPIAYAFFDPASEKYEVACSEAIPIEVSEASKLAMSQVVEAAGPAGPTELLAETHGLLANYEDIDGLLVDQRLAMSAGWWVLLLAPPPLFLVTAVVAKRNERLREDEAYARRRRAAKLARKRFARARQLVKAKEPAGPVCEQLSRAVAHYLGDKLNVPPGGMTAATARRLLAERDVDPERVERLRSALEQCEEARFGTGADGDVALGALVDELEQCVADLEKAKL